MAKLTLTDLSSLENQTTAISTINSNSTSIEAAIENTLSRDGTAPNAMGANLDMNNNRILNLPAPTSDNEPARYGDIQSYVDIAEDSAASALASANSAAESEANALVYSQSAETIVANSIGSGYYYKYDNGTSSGTTSGYIRLNNATLSSATVIYINDLTQNTTDISAEILSWDNSVSVLGKGKLIITRVSDGKQVIFSITNTASDLSGEVSLPCSYVSGLTSLTDEDSVSIIFLPTGNDGAGTGDVIGPASSTDNTLPRFNGSGGKTIQASSIVVDDSNNISGINNTTGSDTDLVSGTAGTSGHSAIWNVDGDLVGSGTLETDYYRVGGTDVPVTDGGTGASTATNARTNLSAAAMSQTFGLSGLIATPSNKDFRIVVNIPFAGTITKVTTRSASGTCTATFKVNTTALGGTANSVSSTEQEQAHASSNTFSVGDDIVITVSSNSSCVDMSFTILYTRTLS